ncbi:MAG: type II toxin-antitoxin system VapC family toxin [Euryarchaeota archaeon]|nr:type II toxin-antitoxin system VapC family toxin [Euryarchaeota archaeon]
MVCLDSSFLVDISRGEPGAREKLQEMLSRGERVVTTIINAAEMYEGAWEYSRARERVDEIDRMLQNMVVLDVNLMAVREYGRLKAGLRRQGVSVGDWDLMIAAIALAYGENRIVTRNRKDFERIPGVQVVAY